MTRRMTPLKRSLSAQERRSRARAVQQVVAAGCFAAILVFVVFVALAHACQR